jgi:hypothetical protein
MVSRGKRLRVSQPFALIGRHYTPYISLPSYLSFYALQGCARTARDKGKRGREGGDKVLYQDRRGHSSAPFSHRVLELFTEAQAGLSLHASSC